jgi:hypothetical protein
MQQLKVTMKFLNTRLFTMKAIGLVALTLLLFQCTHPDGVEPVRGKVSFSVRSDDAASGRVSETETPAFVRYVLENEAGEEMTDTVVVYAFGEGFVSEKQDFAVGQYTLQEYFVLNNEHRVLYAAVKAGAPLAPLVEQTLPFAFDVLEEETTEVAPDVLPVLNDSSPADFGYVKWSFHLAADFVKFILPVEERLIPNFKSARLVVVQGNYTDTVLLKGSASSGLYANVLVKSEIPVELSVFVEADDVFIDRLPFNPNMGDDVLYNTSLSRFVFNRTVPSIACEQFLIPEFRHKLGHGWDFDFAEITSHGENDAWFTIQYQGGDYCNPHVQITTNASEFGSQTAVDKIVWEGFSGQPPFEGVWQFFGEPTCANGVCTLAADLSTVWHEDYEEFADACASNEWVMFDSEARVETFVNGNRGFLTTYFKVEKDTAITSVGRKANTPDAFKMVREDLLKK